MDFMQRVPFGSTGLPVSRIGVASGYGVPAAAIEKAVQEHGINYLYVSPLLNLQSMTRAVRNVAPRQRDDFFVVLARPYFGGFGALRLERFVERWLRKLGLDQVDLLLQDVRKPMTAQVTDRVRQLREAGKVRFFGVSSHERTFLGTIARGAVSASVDFFHLRYNAVHTGAEQDIFPHLSPNDRPGVVVYTATCWRKLLKPKLMPAGEEPLTATECYRFVLSHSDVNVCITSPKTAEQLDANLTALDAGPLNEEEMTRARRIGAYIYGKRRSER